MQELRTVIEKNRNITFGFIDTSKYTYSLQSKLPAGEGPHVVAFKKENDTFGVKAYKGVFTATDLRIFVDRMEASSGLITALKKAPTLARIYTSAKGAKKGDAKSRPAGAGRKDPGHSSKETVDSSAKKNYRAPAAKISEEEEEGEEDEGEDEEEGEMESSTDDVDEELERQRERRKEMEGEQAQWFQEESSTEEVETADYSDEENSEVEEVNADEV